MPIALLFLVAASESDPDNNIASGSETDVDEGISAADGNFETSKTNSWSGGAAIYYIPEDLPGEAVELTDIYIRARGRVIASSPLDDSISYRIGILGEGINNCWVTWTQDEVNDGFVNKIAIANYSTEIPTVAEWNTGLVEFFLQQVGWSQVMAPDGYAFEWDTFEAEVHYNTAGGGSPILLPRLQTQKYKHILTR